MKITDMRAAVIQGNFEWTLVRVYTDVGITGIGECFPGAAVKEIVLKTKPVILGEDPMNVGKLWWKMRRAHAGFGSTEGLVMNAITGIETALCDIVGKALKTPVHNLLGGQYRDRIRIYADCHAGESYTPDSYAEKAREMKELGFTALKFDIDVPTRPRMDHFDCSVSPAELRYVVSLARAAREAIGPDTDLAVDCHWGYNTNAAIAIANALEDLNLLWFEDPVGMENVEAMAMVTRSTKTPICTGENLTTRHGFRELIVKQAVNIIAPDFARAGGMLEGKKIADLADIYYISVAPHNIASPIGTIAAVHLCAAIPNFLVLEYHAKDVPWWDDLIMGERPLIRDGYIRVPTGPGLGVELNEEVAKEHLKEGETLFE